MAVPARKQSSPPSPAEILELIAARKAELPGLLSRQNEAAEQSITSGDEAGYQAAVAAVTACNTDIARLQSALVGANARSREQAEAQQRAAQAAVRERVGKILEQRVATVARIESATAELVKGWRELVELSDRAHGQIPGGALQGMALSNAELIQLLGAELFRQGSTPPVTGRPMLERMVPSLPPPKCPNYLWINQPEMIPKLSTAIEQANKTALNHMEGKRNVAAA
jgi:hypothetical protein